MEAMLIGIGGIVLVAIVAIVVVVLVRALAFKPPAFERNAEAWQPDEAAGESGESDAGELDRLARAIRIETIGSASYEQVDFAPFDEFIAFLQESFPLFNEQCTLERVNGYALIYRWAGSDEALLPVALMAHYDVVPVEEGTTNDWEQPPFSGAVVDGVIWGRGTLDIKSQLTAYLEAAERLMREGSRPRRTLYFCFGHDEENGGAHGAAAIVEHLRTQGVRLEAVLDEGGFVVSGAMKGIDVPIGLIGIAEKGTSNLQIEVEGEGGHSSMPPKNSSLGMAAKVVAQIEQHPLPARLSPPAEGMLRGIAGEMGFAVRMALANLWLMRPVLLRILGGNVVTNSMVRTTFAVTQAQASDAPNVLPQTTRITINVRLLSGDTTASVQRYFEELATKVGATVRVKPLLAQEASPVSPTDTPFYGLLTDLMGEIYPNAVPTPYLVMGATDSRYFYALSNNVYRFTPIWITNEDRAHIHSTNESLSTTNYYRMIHFYERLMHKL
jgi:carboxypeptidase PM20D1